MTRKELNKYFSSPIYEGTRKYAKRVMKERPEISDPNVIEFAACMMEQCGWDSVELSVDNALRLTKDHDPVPTMEELSKRLERIGLDSDEKMLALLQNKMKDIQDSEAQTITMTTVARAAEMTRLGKLLEDGNADIVLMSIPAKLSSGEGMLKLAFFTDSLSDDEQKTIYDLRLLSDKVKFTTKNGIGYGIFRIYVK